MKEFNPHPHLIDIRGKRYLEVKWRLVWLRQEHPDWSITTELLEVGDPVIVRAVVSDATGRTLATGHAEYPRGRQFPSIMKAETAAVGRALAHAGFGTQFAGEDVEEADLVDAPVARPLGGRPLGVSPANRVERPLAAARPATARTNGHGNRQP
jgi:hypothetical protein